LIFAHVLQKKKLREIRGEELKNFNLNPEQIKTIESMVDCRLSRMPVQYILQEWEFRDLLLKMRVPVFIPRPETEEIVELIVQQLDPEKNHKILEVGSGSGCICLSLLDSLPNTKTIVAIDQSQAAVNLTEENALRLGFAERVKVFKHKIESDFLPEEIAKHGPFDIIVSNPPYVPSKDILKLQPEIFLYEDIRALEAGPEGLNVIQILLQLAAKHLRPRGNLWLEVDPRQPEIIKKVIENNHDEWNLKFISSYNDIFKKERFVEIEKD
jgi:release factor glutamine methyltransferase